MPLRSAAGGAGRAAGTADTPAAGTHPVGTPPGPWPSARSDPSRDRSAGYAVGGDFVLYTICFVAQTSVWGYPFRTPPGPLPLPCPDPIRSGCRIRFSDFSRETRFARVPASLTPAPAPFPARRRGSRATPRKHEDVERVRPSPGALPGGRRVARPGTRLRSPSRLRKWCSEALVPLAGANGGLGRPWRPAFRPLAGIRAPGLSR